MPSHRSISLFFALLLLLLGGCGPSDPGAAFAERLATARAMPPATRSAVPLAAPPTSPMPSASPTITPDALFDWAERVLPQFFPAPATSYDLPPFRFRYYPATDLYLAVEGGERVLLLGAPTSWQILVVGNLADFAPLVNAPPTATVADIQPDRLSYFQVTTFRVTGTGLDAGLTAVLRGCAETAPVLTATATEVLVGCTVAAAGADAVGLELRSPSGAVLANRSFTVAKPQVTMTTTLGTIVIELEPTATPLSTNNFLRYVQAGFYDNTIFHRVVRAGIGIAQGGWLTPAPAVKAGAAAPIPLETNRGLSNRRGTIAMVRTSLPDTATSQFYFNVTDNLALDYASAASPGYAVFGQVVQGLPVLDALGALPTATRFGLADFPTAFVIVQSVTQTR